MAHVSGPTSGLPGRRYPVPVGTMCDDHPDRLAVKRIQGETDSFGAEYHDLCQECIDAMDKSLEEADTSGNCDWCGLYADKTVLRRDQDEGLYGRLYSVCISCCIK